MDFLQDSLRNRRSKKNLESIQRHLREQDEARILNHATSLTRWEDFKRNKLETVIEFIRAKKRILRAAEVSKQLTALLLLRRAVLLVADLIAAQRLAKKRARSRELMVLKFSMLFGRFLAKRGCRGDSRAYFRNRIRHALTSGAVIERQLHADKCRSTIHGVILFILGRQRLKECILSCVKSVIFIQNKMKQLKQKRDD